MTARAYLVPLAGDGSTTSTLRPAYVDGLAWGAMRYGIAPVFLVGVEVDDAQHATIAAQVPVTALPADLAAVLSDADAAALAAELETWGIPGELAIGGYTVGDVERGIAAACLIAQRLHGLGEPIPAGLTLARPFVSLPTTYRERLVAVLAELNLSRAGTTPTMHLGAFLATVAAEWAGPIPLGPLVL